MRATTTETRTLVLVALALAVALAVVTGAEGGRGSRSTTTTSTSSPSNTRRPPAARKSPEVRLRTGRLRGEWRATVRRNLQYASFRGIPYATPPLGPLRFKDPRPLNTRWTGVRNATAFAAECMQVEGENVKGEEDCLFLNVYSPPGAFPPSSKATRDPLPVLVFIPGGAFVRGSSNRYGPDYFMEAGGALLVTLNYRLGVLGFLSLGTADVPGNAALKDQTLALRWVRDNIALFGGDPGRVTIFGQSAGGVSVHAHVLSPYSAGLFTAAISISGSLLASWALPRNPELQRNSLLERAGCLGSGPSARPEAVAACLRQYPAQQLVKVAGNVVLMTEMLRYQQIPFTPVVDGGVPGTTPFLPEHPDTLVATGRFNRVPYAASVTSGEVLFFMASAPANTPQYVESGLANLTSQFKEQLASVLPANLALNMTDLAKDTYRPRSLSGEDVLEKLIEAANDLFFVWPAVLTTRLQSVFEPRQYLYYFDLDGALDHRKPALQPFLSRLPGVPHGGDISYLFRFPESNTTLPEDSIEMKTLRSYVQIILNFAISGRPTPQPVQGVIWPPFDSDPDGDYLNFGNNLLSIRAGLREKQVMVWDLLHMLTSSARASQSSTNDTSSQ